MPVQNSTPPRFHELSLRASKRLQWLFWIANGLGLLAIFLSAAPTVLKMAVLSLLLLLGAWQWRREFSGSSPARIVALRWRPEQFQLRMQGSQEWQDAELLPGSRCWPGWLVLRLQTAQGRRQLVLPSDAGDAEQLRRLQLLLRLQSPERHRP